MPLGNMKIGIDANWAIYEKAGIGKYSENLIRNLLQEDKKNEYVLFLNFFRNRKERLKDIKKLTKDSRAKVSIEFSPIPAKIKQWLALTSFPIRKLFKSPIDLFYSPYPAGIAKSGWKKQVVTIYDLTFLKFPEHRGSKISSYYLKTTKQAIENCQKIIAISASTKNDLVKMLKVDPDKIKVIYPSVDENFKPIKDTGKTKKIINKYLSQDQEFILSVGTLEPRKNLVRLIKAYALLPIAIKNKYKLVLVGGSGWNNSDIFKTINDLNLKDKIIKLGYVEQSDLPYIYNAAAVFVYPSLYEGFGLPPLEAMACGVPVITSEVSSLPEVVGSAAKLVNPKSEKEIAEELKNVLKSGKIQLEMKIKGIEQAKKFSWEKTAKETIKLFKEINLKS